MKPKEIRKNDNRYFIFFGKNDNRYLFDEVLKIQ